ncbi:MAG: hypothetical protein ABS949_13860 [Solibacillus sp.]
MEQQNVQWSMVVVIALTAFAAFWFGVYSGEPLDWFLYIVLVAIGLFIHTVILVLRTDDEQIATETKLKKKA